jgi:hypothetical protein
VIGQALAVGRSTNRDAVARYLHELAVTFRDVMAGDESLMINSERAAELEKAAGAWDRKHLPGMIDRISRARYEILVRNMNVDATLVSLFIDLHRVTH